MENFDLSSREKLIKTVVVALVGFFAQQLAGEGFDKFIEHRKNQ